MRYEESEKGLYHQYYDYYLDSHDGEVLHGAVYFESYDNDSCGIRILKDVYRHGLLKSQIIYGRNKSIPKSIISDICYNGKNKKYNSINDFKDYKDYLLMRNDTSNYCYTSFFDDGKVYEWQTYNFELANRNFAQYYPSGQLKLQIIEDKSGKITKSWDESGQLIYEEKYTNDTFHYLNREWHELGGYEDKGSYTKESCQLRRKRWDKNGRVVEDFIEINGVISDGVCYDPQTKQLMYFTAGKCTSVEIYTDELPVLPQKEGVKIYDTLSRFLGRL
jgi:antitoxin component YwqK of YwqJK toxin-antitoxin module